MGPIQQAHTLRVLSYNIQAGLDARHYRDYVTRSWRHVLHHPNRSKNLDRIAELIRGYDVVGLQEADAGSLRSGNINQTAYLADAAGFPFWDHQTNRKVANIAQASNGLLSRFAPNHIEHKRLPGLPGRGAMLIWYGDSSNPLLLVIAHLALGQRSRKRQLQYLSRPILEAPNAIFMGDLNTRLDSPELQRFIHDTGLLPPQHGLETFPSWRPKRCIDHILVSPELTVETRQVLQCNCSDHLPIAVEVRLPEHLNIPQAHSWPPIDRHTL